MNAAGLKEHAGLWWKLWWDYLLPKLQRELARIRAEQAERDGYEQILPMPAEGIDETIDPDGAMEDPEQRRLPMPASRESGPGKSNCGPVPMPTG